MGSLPVDSGPFGGLAFPSNTERSPKDSPPIAKKKVCRLSGSGPSTNTQSRTTYPSQFTFDLSQSHKNDSVYMKTTGPRVSMGSLRGSRLSEKRPPSPKTGMQRIIQQPVGILVHRPDRSRSFNKTRRVRFAPKVTVYRMDDDGPVCTEWQALNTEARDKQTFMVRWMNRLQQQHSSEDSSNLDESNPCPSPAQLTPRVPPTSPPSPCLSNWVIAEQPNAQQTPQKVNFTFFEDPVEGIKLKFVLALGDDYLPQDIVVKANMSGSRVRVIASKVSVSGGCRVVEQFNERYHIPMQVDAHLVSARLDIRGNLTVEAPLLTLGGRPPARLTPDGRQL